MSLTRKARLLYPDSRILAAKWVLAQRYIRSRNLAPKPWWGVVRDAPPNHPA